jgi:hypothetical protein
MAIEEDLKPIWKQWCQPYMTNAEFFLRPPNALGGVRHLVVRYEEGGRNDKPDFASGIPDDWSEEDVLELIRYGRSIPTRSNATSTGKEEWPAWEVPARVYGSPTLIKEKDWPKSDKK